MGNQSPGRFRREGREAFEPHCDPLDFCPYMSDSFWDKSHKGDWLEGWEEAEKLHNLMEEEGDTEEYWVTATYPDGEEEMVGEIDLRHINSCTDMPIELEINGVVYKPEF